MDQPRPAEDPGPDLGVRLGFVPGATPAKWARVWEARHRSTPLRLVPIPAAEAEHAVIAGDLDAAILRLPVNRTVLHAIPLYAEEPVVVVPRDHLFAALEESESVDAADLTEEVLLQPADDVLPWAGRPGAPEHAIEKPGRPPLQVPATTPEAIALVAAGIGVVIVPRSLARLHHRKDVTARTLAGGPAAPVGLAWAIDREDDRIEDLVGIVRGRSVTSSRGRPQPSPTPPAAAAGRAQPQRRTGRGQPGRGRRRR